jgi:DNA topoisomerase VI subunit A
MTVRELLLNGITITKRNLYYQLLKYYKDEYVVLSGDLKIISQTLKIKREQLNIIASNKGIINGNIILSDN